MAKDMKNEAGFFFSEHGPKKKNIKFANVAYIFNYDIVDCWMYAPKLPRIFSLEIQIEQINWTNEFGGTGKDKFLVSLAVWYISSIVC